MPCHLGCRVCRTIPKERLVTSGTRTAWMVRRIDVFALFALALPFTLSRLTPSLSCLWSFEGRWLRVEEQQSPDQNRTATQGCSLSRALAWGFPMFD